MNRSASNSASDFPEYAREVKEHPGGGRLAAVRLRGRALRPGWEDVFLQLFRWLRLVDFAIEDYPHMWIIYATPPAARRLDRENEKRAFGGCA
jgi:hypothetical protein